MNLPEILERETEYITTRSISGIEKVRLFHMLYRSICFDSPIYTLLHGSTVITSNGNAVLFGDGVDCIGKTTTALMVALYSKKFVIDEWSLYNQATGSVYGNRKMPLLVRAASVAYLEEALGKPIPHHETEESHFSPSDLGLEIIDTASLKAIISPRPAEKSVLVEETNPLFKLRKLAITANAHRLKFMENSLDRANGFTDNVRKVELIDYTPGFQIPERLMSLPYYEAYLQEPKDIIDLLKQKNL